MSDLQSSKEQSVLHQQAFFQHFYSTNLACSCWKPLKDKYRYYKQQSYNTPKHTNDISFLKKFNTIVNYIPFVQQARPEKVDIPLIQDTIQTIYDQLEGFLGNGGWRVVKNKSHTTHLQEHLLLKLWKNHQTGKIQGSLGKLVLDFFYTLNYYKTCNYEIRLFNEFLLHQQLQPIFIFILLRRKSRRVSKDLTLKSEHIASFVDVLKGEKSHHAFASYTSEHQEMGEVKLLLIYPEIMEHIKNHGVVLHQILIYSLMKIVGLAADSQNPQQTTRIDWNKLLSLYFKESMASGGKNYPHELISRIVKANLRVADSLFKLDESNVTFVEDAQPNASREKFLQESFGWLIKMIEGLIADKQQCKQQWRTMYKHLQLLYQQGLTLGNQLVQALLKSEEYYNMVCRHSAG